MAILFQSDITANNSTNSLSFAPTGHQPGDFVVAMVGGDGTDSIDAQGEAHGWIKAEEAIVSGNHSTAIFYQVLGATPPSSWTFVTPATAQNMAIAWGVFRPGVGESFVGAPVVTDIVSGAGAAGDSTPSIASVGAASVLCVVYAHDSLSGITAAPEGVLALGTPYAGTAFALGGYYQLNPSDDPISRTIDWTVDSDFHIAGVLQVEVLTEVVGPAQVTPSPVIMTGTLPAAELVTWLSIGGSAAGAAVLQLEQLELLTYGTSTALGTSTATGGITTGVSPVTPEPLAVTISAQGATVQRGGRVIEASAIEFSLASNIPTVSQAFNISGSISGSATITLGQIEALVYGTSTATGTSSASGLLDVAEEVTHPLSGTFEGYSEAGGQVSLDLFGTSVATGSSSISGTLSGGFVLAPTPVVGECSILAVTFAVTLRPEAVLVGGGVSSPTVGQGVTITPASLSLGGVCSLPSLVLGECVIGPFSVAMGYSGAAPQTVMGGVFLTPEPANAAMNVSTPRTAHQLSPEAGETWIYLEIPDVVIGPRILTPTPAGAAIGILEPSMSLAGEITVQPGALYVTAAAPRVGYKVRPTPVGTLGELLFPAIHQRLHPDGLVLEAIAPTVNAYLAADILRPLSARRANKVKVTSSRIKIRLHD